MRKALLIIAVAFLFGGCNLKKEAEDTRPEYSYFEVYQQNRYSDGEQFQNSSIFRASSDEEACRHARTLFDIRKQVYQQFVDRKDGSHEYLDRPLFFHLTRVDYSAGLDDDQELLPCSSECMDSAMRLIKKEIERMYR